MEEEEEYLKVNAAQRQTVPAGLQCAVDGDTVRLLTSLTEILMLASVPLLQIVLRGLRLVLSGDTVRRLKDQEEEDKPTPDPQIVVEELENEIISCCLGHYQTLHKHTHTHI